MPGVISFWQFLCKKECENYPIHTAGSVFGFYLMDSYFLLASLELYSLYRQPPTLCQMQKRFPNQSRYY